MIWRGLCNHGEMRRLGLSDLRGTPVFRRISQHKKLTPLIHQTMRVSEAVYDRFIAAADDPPAIPNERYWSKRDRVERFLMNNTIRISIIKTPPNNDEDDQVDKENDPILQPPPQPTIDGPSDPSTSSTAPA